MKKYILTILIVTFSLAAFGQQKDLPLVGKGVLTFNIFPFSWDVYEVSYHKDQKSREKLHFRFLRDVEAKHLKQAWAEGLEQTLGEKAKEYLNQTQMLADKTPSVVENQTMTLLIENGKLKYLVDNELKLEIKNPQFSKGVLNIWLGEDPVDEDLRDQLLNKNNS